MKHLFLSLILVFSLFTFSYSQSPNDGISDLVIRYRNIGDDMIPPSVNDPAYQNRKVIMEITFTIANPDTLKEIEIKGLDIVEGNTIVDMKLIASKEGSTTQLNYNGRSYTIEGNSVSIEQEIPESSLKKKRKLTVKAINKSNVITNTLTKETN